MTAGFGLLVAGAISNTVLPDDYGTRSAEDVLAGMGYDPSLAESFEKYRDIRVYDNNMDGFLGILANYDFDLLPFLVTNNAVANPNGNDCTVILYGENFSVRDKFASRLDIAQEKMELPDRINKAWQFLTLVHEFRHCVQPGVSVPDGAEYKAMLTLLHEIDSDLSALNYSMFSEDPHMREALIYYGHMRSFDNINYIAENYSSWWPYELLDHVTALGIYGGGYTAEQIVTAHAELMPHIVARMDNSREVEGFLQIYDIAQEFLENPDLDAIQRDILQKYVASVEFITPSALGQHVNASPAAATLEF